MRSVPSNLGLQPPSQLPKFFGKTGPQYHGIEMARMVCKVNTLTGVRSAPTHLTVNPLTTLAAKAMVCPVSDRAQNAPRSRKE